MALLAACDIGHDYQRPALDLPEAYRATAETAAAAWPSADWWRGFQSPALDGLIEQARAGNFDIAASIARVRQADAQVRIAGAPLLPDISGNASGSWQHTGINTLSGRGGGSNGGVDLHSYSTGLGASYELDFWGRNRAVRQSAVASALFSRFDQQTVALTIVTNVANTWFIALSLADRLAVARRNLRDAEQALAVIKGRFDAGTASQLDIAQQETLVATERALIPGFASQLEQELIALGILTGQPPERIMARPGTLTALQLPLVAPGLPSELLIRRPDVAAAEAQLMAQKFNITVARAAFFPSIKLTASTGFQGPALNRLITPGGALAALTEGLTADLRRRHPARTVGPRERPLRRVAGGLPQGGGAGVHRCRYRAGGLALRHGTGKAATGRGRDRPTRRDDRAGADGGGNGRYHHGFDNRDLVV